MSVLTSMGFDDDRQQLTIAALSGGWKMKLALGRAMLMKADILVRVSLGLSLFQFPSRRCALVCSRPVCIPIFFLTAAPFPTLCEPSVNRLRARGARESAVR